MRRSCSRGSPSPSTSAWRSSRATGSCASSRSRRSSSRDIALVGVYLFDDSILEACATLTPSWRGEYEITEAIQWLIDNGKTVRAEMVGGYWKDTGRPEDLLEANRMMLATLEPAIAARSTTPPPSRASCVVASGARVDGQHASAVRS